jgi:hypothetical protein
MWGLGKDQTIQIGMTRPETEHASQLGNNPLSNLPVAPLVRPCYDSRSPRNLPEACYPGGFLLPVSSTDTESTRLNQWNMLPTVCAIGYSTLPKFVA